MKKSNNTKEMIKAVESAIANPIKPVNEKALKAQALLEKVTSNNIEKSSKYGEGKHKQLVVVKTKTGKIVNQLREVGTTKKEVPELGKKVVTHTNIDQPKKKILPEPLKVGSIVHGQSGEGKVLDLDYKGTGKMLVDFNGTKKIFKINSIKTVDPVKKVKEIEKPIEDKKEKQEEAPKYSEQTYKVSSESNYARNEYVKIVENKKASNDKAVIITILDENGKPVNKYGKQSIQTSRRFLIPVSVGLHNNEQKKQSVTKEDLKGKTASEKLELLKKKSDNGRKLPTVDDSYLKELAEKDVRELFDIQSKYKRIGADIASSVLLEKDPIVKKKALGEADWYLDNGYKINQLIRRKMDKGDNVSSKVSEVEVPLSKSPMKQGENPETVKMKVTKKDGGKYAKSGVRELEHNGYKPGDTAYITVKGQKMKAKYKHMNKNVHSPNGYYVLRGDDGRLYERKPETVTKK